MTGATLLPLTQKQKERPSKGLSTKKAPGVSLVSLAPASAVNTVMVPLSQRVKNALLKTVLPAPLPRLKRMREPLLRKEQVMPLRVSLLQKLKNRALDQSPLLGINPFLALKTKKGGQAPFFIAVLEPCQDLLISRKRQINLS
jgi:hypothetical protein